MSMEDLLALRGNRGSAQRRRGSIAEAPRAGSDRETAFGPGAALGIALWFGLLVGPLELGLSLASKALHDPSPLFFRMNRHVLWATPVADLGLFGLCGLVVALAVGNPRRRTVRWAVGVLAALALLALLLTFPVLHVLGSIGLSGGLACRLSRTIEDRLGAFRRLVRRSTPPLAAIAIGLIGVALGRHVLDEYRAQAALGAVAAPGAGAPNVLLIVLDTVRADRLSLYGYGRNTAPNLTRLARRGITFAQARSTAPWTLPSHASMMTGYWPHQQSARLHGPLDGTRATIAEFLTAHGYATAGFVANTTYCGAETGLARGFAHYEDHELSAAGVLCASTLGRRLIWPVLAEASRRLGGPLKTDLRKDAARVSGDLLAWVEQPRPRPFFAFVNYLDAHSPYVLPAGFDRHFGLKPETRGDFATLDDWFTLDKAVAGPREVQLASHAYDDCLAYLDDQLGRLFTALERSGGLEDTLVIITADHGESFGEHDLYCHASSLYDPEIHVPLLILLPGGGAAGTSVAAPVSLRDLPATIADLVGLGGSARFPGRSLARYWKAPAGVPAPPGPEPCLAEVDGPAKTAPNLGRSPAFRGPMQAVVCGQDVYIRKGDGSEELYDLTADPAQRRDLARAPNVGPRLDARRALLEQLTRDDTRPLAWRSTAGGRRHAGKWISPAPAAHREVDEPATLGRGHPEASTRKR
jgi:arylsulfatase A-like enzyme